jgi:hypothetical protein
LLLLFLRSLTKTGVVLLLLLIQLLYFTATVFPLLLLLLTLYRVALLRILLLLVTLLCIATALFTLLLLLLALIVVTVGSLPLLLALLSCTLLCRIGSILLLAVQERIATLPCITITRCVVLRCYCRAYLGISSFRMIGTILFRAYNACRSLITLSAHYRSVYIYAAIAHYGCAGTH